MTRIIIHNHLSGTRDAELTGSEKQEYDLLKKKVDASEYYEKLSKPEYRRWKYLNDKQGTAP